MCWRDREALNERLRFVQLYKSHSFAMSELCRRFGISRPTGYGWLSRYAQQGAEGLLERSRRPHRSPNRTPSEIESRIVELRKQYPQWGPVTVVGYLRQHDPDRAWPAPSTTSAILKRHGLVQARRKRRQVLHPGRPYLPMEAPNDTWAVDFKGEFKTRDGRYCYPLTITDGHSRFLLACRARLATAYELARPVFEETFRCYGLPRQILSDSGSPFGSSGLAGLSRLSVWWLKLGIQPVRIQPSHPEQNGRHERMHRTLAATTRPPAANLSAQQRRFSRFMAEYNQLRPHRALDLRTPAQLYTPSSRPYSSRTPQVNYPAHFEVRKADIDGRISWHDRPLRICKVLRGELIGLEPIEERRYHVFFGPLLLGVFDQDSWQIHG